MQLLKQGLLEQFRAQIVDDAFAYGFDCRYDGRKLWFVRSGSQRVIFSLSRRGLRAAHRWLKRLDRLLLVA